MPENCELSKYKIFSTPYKLIVFDWDGTAVENRQVDASEVTGLLRCLIERDVIIAIITGTNVHNVMAQIQDITSSSGLKNLYILTNRGSEVYGFDEDKKLVLIYERHATKQEKHLLDDISIKTRNAITSISNTNINIVFNRMNRRKIDLIPEWENPQKNEIDKLLFETEKNLTENGFSGGMKEAYEILKIHARAADFNQAKITSDVKHLEIGLTDKSDSMRWIMENIASKKKIKENEILVGGDEFGTVAGFEGSDSKMILDGYPDITYISVGIEPEGVPEKVIHARGGPACFCRVLEMQLEL